MKTVIGSALGLVLAATAQAAAVPTDQLAKPPADARSFTIMSVAGKHGTAYEWTAPDGTLMARVDLTLRGQEFHLDEATRLGPDGAISDYVLRGSTPNGDAGETFRVANGTASWKSQVDAGSAPYKAGSFYVPSSIAMRPGEVLTEWLIAHPQAEGATLLPGGVERVKKLTTTTVGAGPTQKTVVLWEVDGIGSTPGTVWTDAQGKTWANIGFLSFVPAGYENDVQRLNKIQDAEIAKLSPVIAHTLAPTPPGPVVFQDVQVFAEGGRWLKHQTVVVTGGKISAIAPAGGFRAPAGATIIAGAGKTLVPGLWDCHLHVGDDFTGPQELALGVTSVRDPGNNDELTISRRQRRAAGDLLGPHVYASSLIDGKGPNTAQVANVVTSEAEAIKAVDDAKAKGQTGVKFYGTFNPAWVTPAAAEAHKLGLHVHGHLPAGMRPMDAIADGYDEVTHIYFVSMQAMPNDVVATSNGMNRFSGTGKYMKDVDLDADPMKTVIATMAAKHIYSDPTLVVVEGLFVPENGDLSAAYAPFVGSLPPAVERGFRQGGFAPTGGATRADYRASFAKEEALVGKMHKAGVPIVAGTDGSGLELVRELELYVDAGFTNAEALEAATIVPARLVGADGHTGSIVVGKDADVALVDGDPSTRIGDLRHTRVVMMDGKLMDADKLRSAVGISRRPAMFAVAE
jgi:imidazolonepropionase-like amidohydrolase